MLYYLVLDSELVNNSKDLFTEKYELVRTSFETAYPQHGFSIFEQILEQGDIGQIKIFDEDGNEMNIGSFMKMLEEHNLKQ